jgi:membrane-associated phospholipid phosphatase
MLWAMLVSLSRTMLAAHYLGDILVGSLFGLTLGLTLAYAVHKLLVKAKL